MNIYFAGSIRGGREDLDLYQAIVELLGAYGAVLTEHVANGDVLKVESKSTDKEIYKRDMDWLVKSDVVIAEVTQPSLGVGYEIGQAEAMGKKVLCLYRNLPGKNLSAMIAGNPHVRLEEYESGADLDVILKKFLAKK